MTNNTDNVVVYLGDPFENLHEERFLSKLRRDLVSRGTRAFILANFVTPRNQRQVDFFVLTDFRLVHVELKSLSARAPLTGKCNGPWQQNQPGGLVHTIEPNPYQQAHKGTYAIKDVATALIEGGRVPAVGGPFYKHIDTVVCVDPDIPAGSQLDRYTFVEAVGYAELLDRLTRVGPRPSWGLRDWQELCRHLGLYPEGGGLADRPTRATAAQRKPWTSTPTASLRHSATSFTHWSQWALPVAPDQLWTSWPTSRRERAWSWRVRAVQVRATPPGTWCSKPHAAVRSCFGSQRTSTTRVVSACCSPRLLRPIALWAAKTSYATRRPLPARLLSWSTGSMSAQPACARSCWPS